MSKIRVTTTTTELEMIVPKKTRGCNLFYELSKNLGIHEVWYFGLMFLDAYSNVIWFDSSKKSVSDIRTNALRLKYRIKYYAEDASTELIEDVTIANFYYQVRSDILAGEIYCPPDTCVLLASYSIQVKHGDYNARKHNNGFLSKQRIIPRRVFDQFNMKRETWEDTVIQMWQKHNGMLAEDAMIEYLKLAQNLSMYGVSYFDIRNKKGTRLLLGVDCLGLNVYKQEDRLNPIIAFPWSEIKNINFKGIKFTIKPTDSHSKFFIFFSADPVINKRILNLSIGNHLLYMRRRKKESLEVQQMKVKAAERKKQKLQDRARLLHETLAREQAEKREQQYQEQIKAMQEEMERGRANLADAQLTIYKLQEQLRELQIAKQMLEEEQYNLKKMMQRLEFNKSMEEAEKEQLMDEIRRKQEEVDRIQFEVEFRDKEARKLQEEIDAAKRLEEELLAQKELARREKEEQAELEIMVNANNKLPSLVEVNDQLRNDLKELQLKLEDTRLHDKETEEDKIHRINMLEGRDKYKTLNEIRKGNTIRRIDMFENM